MSKFVEVFSDIKDNRQQIKVLYPLIEIVFLLLTATISGADDFVAIETFGTSKIDFLRKFFPFKNGIPTHETIGAILSSINPHEFSEYFIQWTSLFASQIKGVVAIDGKTIRGSYDKRKEQSALHIVSAWATTNKIALGQFKVGDKTNEITAIPKLLKMVCIKGCIVTIDAMGCQKEITHKIAEYEADYILALKQNHKELYEDVTLFLQDKPLMEGSVEKDHGRIEIRRVHITSDIGWLTQRHSAWMNLKSIGVIESERIVKGKSSVERRYYISSLHDDPIIFSQAVRSHWGIENSLHWVLDVNFKEDSSRLRDKNAVENLALIRKAAINLLQKNKSKTSIRGMRFKSALDDQYLCGIIMSS